MPKKKTPPKTPPKKGDTDQLPALQAPPAGFTIVGIAASAGGLQALKGLFSAMPAQTGAAFVLVPHLDPSHPSMMLELLRPYTKMPLQEVQDGMRVQPDTAYIVPSNRKLEIHDGALHLLPLTDKDVRYTPIDPFLRSLAEDQQERAVGIVLSGTGSYGTLGLQDIKANGGMTMAQDPGEAEYDLMPQNAISASVVDHILPVARMPEALIAFIHRSSVETISQLAETSTPPDYLTKILTMIRARTKYSFREYRKNMLLRRIHRRMSVHRIDDPNKYIALLRDDADELNLLYQDFLIGVSSFFRDPEAFAALAQQVIPEVFRHKADSDTPIRIWVPGCATGEEAYSIAILLHEEMDRVKKYPPFQIFATDINEQGLKAARMGMYPEGIAADVSPERLRRFFINKDHHYQVNEQLRKSIMFAAQNVIGDTPFSKLDLICCRNLLIYLEPETQQTVLALFHFALNQGGYLFLGGSETVGRQHDMFEPISTKLRIFRRIGPSRPDRINYAPGCNYMLPPLIPAVPEAKPQSTKIVASALELLADAYAPACVLVTRRFEILYLREPMHKYLRMPSGEPTNNLLALAYPGLKNRIRGLCAQLKDSPDGEVHGDVTFQRNSHQTHVRVGVKELKEPNTLEGLLLVTFEDLAVKDQMEPAKASDAVENNTLVQQLENELKATQEDLQSTIEELQSSNEEMKSANEEMMSMNEELQSSNEELETSKEELQSLNEELNTVNNQLEDKIVEVDGINNDLINLLKSSEIATVFLDPHLRIRRFTPSSAKLLNLIPSDIGRDIGDFSYKIQGDDLVTDARAVLERLAPVDKHVWSKEGLCYLRRILPYRTESDRIEGVVITFVDVTAQMQIDVTSRRLAALLRESNDAIVIQDATGHVLDWNDAAQRIYGYSKAEALGMDLQDITPPNMQDELRVSLAALANGKSIPNFQTQRIRKDGQTIDVSVTMTRVADIDGKNVTLMGIERDISLQKELERKLRYLSEKLKERADARTAETRVATSKLRDREMYLAAILDTAPDAIITMDAAGIIKSCNLAAANMLGCVENDVENTNVSQFFPVQSGGRRRTIVDEYMRKAKSGAMGSLLEITALRRDGAPLAVEVSMSKIDDHDLYVAIVRDVGERKNLEKEVIEAASREQERIGSEFHDGLGQQLTALTMMASDLERHLKAQKSAEGAKAQELKLQLQQAITQAQRLARGLAPVPQLPEGLAASLKGLLKNACEALGITYHLKISRSVTIEDHSIALHLYRIIQEAVNNAVKHAKPKNISVEMTAHGGRIELKISDDGKGAVPSKLENHGAGPRIMRYRADVIGASLEIRSEKGKGTIVLCTLPYGQAGTR